jgi:peptidoglycan/xylan/chitin deacetylase (PgdA/CDA1 family)
MASSPAPITTLRAFTRGGSPVQRLRGLARDAAIFALSQVRAIPHGTNWLRFPYYHHVFDDERAGFVRQLRLLRNHGDFVSLDDAVEILGSDSPPKGRYFCVTFDDGFKNCIDNAVPILLDHGATAAFFLPTRFIGTSFEKDGETIASFFDGSDLAVEFLSWDDCRAMARAGMTIGSHTVSHVRLIELTEARVEDELRASKDTIERQLAVPCRHFCCPWGRFGIDYRPDREPTIARRLGYQSFLSTRRGSFQRRSLPMQIDRDHIVAAWSVHQLRYFFSR